MSREGILQDADGVCECDGRQAALRHSAIVVCAGGAVPSRGHRLAVLLDWKC